MNTPAYRKKKVQEMLDYLKEIGLSVYGPVIKERAVQILSEAIEIEQNYHRIMQSRFDKAVGALIGELDG